MACLSAGSFFIANLVSYIWESMSFTAKMT